MKVKKEENRYELVSARDAIEMRDCYMEVFIKEPGDYIILPK
jgi:hypothetical protein